MNWSGSSKKAIERLKTQVKSAASKQPLPAKTDALEQLDVVQQREFLAQKSSALLLTRVCVGTLLALLVWASFATVPQASHGTARVIPSQKLQVVQAVDGGIITQVLVAEGDLVTAGQTLIQIDTTRFNSSLNEKEAVEASLTLRQARLQAQLDGKPFEIPVDISAKFPQIYQQETQLLDNKRREWAALTQISEEQLMQRQRELEEAQSLARASKQSFDLLSQELNQTRPLLRTGAISPVELMRVERDVAKAEGDYKAAQSQMSRLNSAIQEARQKIKEIRFKLENETRQELSEVKGKLASLSQNKVELTDRVAQATIKAPVAGLVQRILYNTKGAVVPAGREIIEIVPADELLVFETRISPKDIAFIKADQKATIRVTAYDYTVYGSLEGKVDAISADSLQDEYGNPYYSVKVNAPRTQVNPKIKLIPGMVAEVSIQTDMRRVITYLTKPIMRGMYESFTEN
ncbi:MAG: HlyD family type I secretion periplasmic adaptor subunit [Limnobacter sp.]|nr:HlyD family type I secretion periplasmic adaptor subunit [Limnobacter sp.]